VERTAGRLFFQKGCRRNFQGEAAMWFDHTNNQKRPGQAVDRYFGTVTKLLPGGGAVLRRLDGRGDVALDATGAARVGERLRVGMHLEFEIVGGPGAWRAYDPCNVNAGARRFAVSS
jgi:hypothetical protein